MPYQDAVVGLRSWAQVLSVWPRCARVVSGQGSQIGISSPVAHHAGSNQAIFARLQAADSLAAFLERAQIFKLFEEVHGGCPGQAMP
jgi:hypothetical protein